MLAGKEILVEGGRDGGRETERNKETERQKERQRERGLSTINTLQRHGDV
jgi:hypothetical protein